MVKNPFGEQMHIMGSKAIYWFCVAVLIATNVWSLAVLRRVYRVNELSPVGADMRSISQLRQVQFANSEQTLSDLGSNDRTVLLFLFTPYDCPAAVQELEGLEALHLEHPTIDIRAVALFQSPEEASQIRREFKLTYPVLSDPPARVKTLLNPPQTPWKLYLGPKYLNALMEDGPAITNAEQEAFRFRVASLENGFLAHRVSGSKK